ncbi:MAG: lamin tail domain-containing protein [Crocinitomicaceae bacterium]|nr:lamin tail domain-containing protein [Crocinitomicaceae bacterium]MDP4799787.1 lamin tail domain-containing protein [Crocinitomicaceae bacterium]
MRLFLILFFLLSACTPRPVLAQVFDDFHDQSLFQGLLWGGDIGAFQTNGNRQLQLNAASAGAANLYFAHQLNNSTNWECQFWLRLNFSPSSLNFGRFYLVANQSDLLLADQALYLEFGEAGSQDAPKLFCRQNGIDSLVGVGPAGSVAAAFQLFFSFKYNNGVFTLETKTSTAAASNLWLSGQLPWLPAGPYAGLSCIFTSANSQGFYLDDLYVGPLLEQQVPNLFITELMVDPEPQQGLPNAEYIEIYNAGANAQQLNGFVLSDATGSCTLPSYWLQPGAYATLVGTGQSSGFNPSKTIEVSAFTSLNNTGETLQLKNAHGLLLDQVAYQISWYQDSVKMNGGYSLERCSLLDPCSAADNWRATQAQLGGTPGLQNSVFEAAPDTLAPFISWAEVRDSNQVAFVFSEPMDSASLALCAISFDHNLGAFTRTALNYLQIQNGAQLLLIFENSLPKSEPIEVSFTTIKDCWANTNNQQATFIRYEVPQPGDLLINEILFDPPSNGSDFIELYNVSQKYLDLKQCSIGNGQATYAITKPSISPRDYLALSPDTSFLSVFYPNTPSEKTAFQTLPYLYNDSGTCILYSNGSVLDQLTYNDTWHTALIIDTEGVSLERLDAAAPTQNPNNWFSAAQNVGFASPGRSNSQQIGAKQNGALYLTQPEFSPDQDGYHDFLEIQYELPAPNMLVQADIYTLGGNLVKKLIVNELFGTKGVLIWDGSTEYGTIATNGIYILEFKAFSTDPSVFFNRRLSFARCIKR